MSVQFDPVVSPATPSDRSAQGPFGPLLALLRAIGSPAAAELPGAPRLVVFGADHGIAAQQVSAYAPSDTGDRLAKIAGGAGPVGAVAGTVGVGVRVVDLRRPRETDDTREQDPYAGFQPSGRIDIEDALTAAQVTEAIDRGRQAADEEIDSGADLLIGAVCAVGVSTPTAVLVAAITGLEPVDATSRGSGIGDASWIRKAAAVRDALYRAKQAGTDAVTLLRVAGGADLAALTGFLGQAAVRRTPVLVDDTPTTACAVLANRIAPGADAYVVSAATSTDRGHQRLLDVLGAAPLTNWSLRFGSGVTAMLTIPVVRAVALALTDLDEAHRLPDAIRSWDPDLL